MWRREAGASAGNGPVFSPIGLASKSSSDSLNLTRPMPLPQRTRAYPVDGVDKHCLMGMGPPASTTSWAWVLLQHRGLVEVSSCSRLTGWGVRDIRQTSTPHSLSCPLICAPHHGSATQPLLLCSGCSGHPACGALPPCKPPSLGLQCRSGGITLDYKHRTHLDATPHQS